MIGRLTRSIKAAVKAWRAEPEDATIELNIGHALVALVDTQSGPNLKDSIAETRETLLRDQGLRLPPVRIRDDVRLCGECFTVWINGVQTANGHVALKRRLAVDACFQEDYLTGTGVLEPRSGLPGIWVEEARWAELERAGAFLMTPTSFIAAHLVAGTRFN